MKVTLSLALVSSFAAFIASSASAQSTISTGCFHYGPEHCGPNSAPPSISLGGFQMGEVNPDEGSNVPKFKVVSANCANGAGPKLNVGEVVDVVGGAAAVVVNQTVYQVGKQTTASGSEEGRYVSKSEFKLVSFSQNGSVIATVEIKLTGKKVVITSTSSEVGVCELEAQD
jgi:hypothetical protein